MGCHWCCPRSGILFGEVVTVVRPGSSMTQVTAGGTRLSWAMAPWGHFTAGRHFVFIGVALSCGRLSERHSASGA